MICLLSATRRINCCQLAPTVTRNEKQNGDEPLTPRRGRLRHCNPTGPLFGPGWPGRRCGAKTRQGRPKTRHHPRCLNPAMRNGRCRMHGGKSTGPRTPEGLERSRKARWIHGERSAETRQRYRLYRLMKQLVVGGPREVELAHKLFNLIVFKDAAG